MKRFLIQLLLSLMACSILWVSIIFGFGSLFGSIIVALKLLSFLGVEAFTKTLFAGHIIKEFSILGLTIISGGISYYGVKAFSRVTDICDNFSICAPAIENCQILPSSDDLSFTGAPNEIPLLWKEYKLGSYSWK